MAVRASWFTGVASACAFVSLYTILKALERPNEKLVPTIQVPKRRLPCAEVSSSNCSRRVSVDQLFGQDDDDDEQHGTVDVATTCELLTNIARQLANVPEESEDNLMVVLDLTTAISAINIKLCRVEKASSPGSSSLHDRSIYKACLESTLVALRVTLKSLQTELSQKAAPSMLLLTKAARQVNEHQSSLDFILEHVSSSSSSPPTPPPESDTVAFLDERSQAYRPSSPVSGCSVLIHEEHHWSAPPPEYSPPFEPLQPSLSDTKSLASFSKPIAYEESGLDEAMYEAITQNNVDLVRLLLESQNVDPNIQGGELGRSPLHHAAQLNHIVCITLLIRNGATIAIEDSKGDTPLHLACWSGNCETISVLLSHGADPEYLSGRDSYTPLFCAVMSNHVSAVALLLKFGASATNRSAPGHRSALHQAVSMGSVAIAKLLLQHGGFCCVDIGDEEDQTPLHYACAAGSAECAQLLLEQGAKVDSRQKSHGMTAMHWAAHTDSVEVIKLLSMYGASINATADGGATPLHLAASKGKIEAVKYLLSQKGVQRKGVAAWNGAQGTPAQLARAKGSGKLAALIESWPRTK